MALGDGWWFLRPGRDEEGEETDRGRERERGKRSRRQLLGESAADCAGAGKISEQMAGLRPTN